MRSLPFQLRCFVAALAVAPRVMLAQTAPVTIHAARVLDGRGGVMSDVIIVVDKGKIVQIGTR
jgi:imidazolonepropionase-like amidohydrolase